MLLSSAATKIRSMSKPVKKTLVVRQFKSETKSIADTKKTTRKPGKFFEIIRTINAARNKNMSPNSGSESVIKCSTE